MIDFNKPVQTKSGRAVRILCTDAPDAMPVIGLVGDELIRWSADGSFYAFYRCASSYDLENVPEDTFVYLNVYLDSCKNMFVLSNPSKAVADQVQLFNRIGCIKVKLEARFDE